MTNLTSQRRLASKIMKVGRNRVRINPQRVEDVESAITREEVRKLVHEKAITVAPIVGVSRGRAKVIQSKKRKGRRKGPGSRSGTPRSVISKKDAWMTRIRSLRRKLRELKTNRTITESTYRELYMIAGSGRFASIADMERYAKAHDMWRKR
ncbi:MAG: 50S ribosomal protein L19e [Candidatus Bathyarchaeota archaeon]|nr:50S ribosomal protein L19e [Candidatus Bathyarchaeota archaeon]